MGCKSAKAETVESKYAHEQTSGNIVPEQGGEQAGEENAMCQRPSQRPSIARRSLARMSFRNLPPVTINGRRLGGDAISTEISPSEIVKSLKAAFALSFDVSPGQLKLAFGNSIMEDGQALVDCGVADQAEISVVILPSLPSWAEGLGLSGEHPALLREYYTKHQLKMEDAWASDDGVWSSLEVARKVVEQSKENLSKQNQDFLLHKFGQPASLLRGSPGEKLTFELKGSLWNENGDVSPDRDESVQQVQLVADTIIIAEIYDGVPGKGKDIKCNRSFKAPDAPGTYMIWKSCHPHWTMGDCMTAIGLKPYPRYPNAFVGWLVVS